MRVTARQEFWLDHFDFAIRFIKWSQQDDCAQKIWEILFGIGIRYLLRIFVGIEWLKLGQRSHSILGFVSLGYQSLGFHFCMSDLFSTAKSKGFEVVVHFDSWCLVEHASSFSASSWLQKP